MDKKELTHFNEAGEAHMVDVHEKEDTYRVAKACGEIKMNEDAFNAVANGTWNSTHCRDNGGKK